MNNNLFHLSNGIIPACDVDTLEKLKDIIIVTSNIEGIVGYKIGCTIALSFGLGNVVKTIRKYSKLPIIYDHQKASTDIPQIGELFAEICGKNNLQSVILFPQSGPQTEEAFISALTKRKIIPMVGGEMTHPMYLEKDGGFIVNDGPVKMYEVAAKMGVEYFIVPGNKPEKILLYHNLIKKFIKNPNYCFPGIGIQGGDLEIMFKSINYANSYAIIGSGIYKAKDIGKAANDFCEIALKYVK